MKTIVGVTFAILGGLACLWAVILLAWNLILAVYPPADYVVQRDDERLVLTAERGDTIKIRLNPGDSLGNQWGTTGIVMELTGPGLIPIIQEIIPSKEPDWGDEVQSPDILKSSPLEIDGEFTIPTTLEETSGSTASAEEPKNISYLGTLTGTVFMPVAIDEDFFDNVAVPLFYEVRLTVVPGGASTGDGSAEAWWQRWLGPSWRNFGVVAGLGLVMFVVGSNMLALHEKGRAEETETAVEPAPAGQAPMEAAFRAQSPAEGVHLTSFLYPLAEAAQRI